jgi:hypothetical protein
MGSSSGRRCCASSRRSELSPEFRLHSRHCEHKRKGRDLEREVAGERDRQRIGVGCEARWCGERVVESTPSQRGFLAHARHLLGEIATHPDRFEAETGEARYHNALALAEPRGMRPLVAHCHLGLGRLFRRTGKHEQQAQEHLTTATTMYREMDMRFWLAQAAAEMAGPH